MSNTNNRYTVRYITPCWVVWDRRRGEQADYAPSREEARKKARRANAMDCVMSNSETPEQLQILGLARS